MHWGLICEEVFWAGVGKEIRCKVRHSQSTIQLKLRDQPLFCREGEGGGGCGEFPKNTFLHSKNLLKKECKGSHGEKKIKRVLSTNNILIFDI